MATTVYSSTLYSNAPSLGVVTTVNMVTPLLANGLDQIRFRFVSHTVFGSTILRASHSLMSGTAWISTATPSEILFSGGHGFTAMFPDLWSDWMPLAGSASAGFTTADIMMIKISYGASLDHSIIKPAATGCHLLLQPGDTVLNVDGVVGGSYQGEWNNMVDLIETQSVGGGLVQSARFDDADSLFAATVAGGASGGRGSVLRGRLVR